MAAEIQFNRKPQKIVEVILYLIHKSPLTRYQIVKFFYLADRVHLRKYGRPVTYDRYVAMKAGPVASTAYDIIKGKKIHGINTEDLPFEITEIGAYWGVANPKREVNFDFFSKSDLKVLDEIYETYHKHSFDDLYELTHQHEAYDKVWKNRTTNADDMSFGDFFDGLENRDSIVDELAFAARGM